MQTRAYPAHSEATASIVQPQQEEWFSQEQNGDRQRCDDQQQSLHVLLRAQRGGRQSGCEDVRTESLVHRVSEDQGQCPLLHSNKEQKVNTSQILSAGGSFPKLLVEF